MKRILFACIIVIPFSIAAYAQQKGKQFAIALTEKLAINLKMDSTEKRKVQAANEQYLNGLTEVLQKDDRREKAQALKKLRNEHEDALKNILTKEQQKQYEAMREEQREKFSDVAAQKLSEEITLKMQDKLNLSVKQSTQADSINTKSFKALLASLMDDDQRGLQKLRAVRQATDERNNGMKKILTEEQYKTYLQMNEEAKEKMKEKMKEKKGF